MRAIVDRAAAVGVEAVVTVADDIVDARWAHQAAHWDERVYAAVALHPTHAGELDDAARAELETMAGDDRVVAVGETGLDYYWIGKSESCATKEQQYEAFAWHIDLAKRLRKAADDPQPGRRRRPARRPGGRRIAGDRDHALLLR